MSLESDLAETRDLLGRVMGQLERIASPLEIKAYKIPEVAEVLRVDRTIVYDLINAGHLPVVLLPTMKEKRIPAAAVDALVAPDRWTVAS